MEYSRAGTYPTAGSAVPHPTPEYVRQMSTPNPPTGNYPLFSEKVYKGKSDFLRLEMQVIW